MIIQMFKKFIPLYPHYSTQFELDPLGLLIVNITFNLEMSAHFLLLLNLEFKFLFKNFKYILSDKSYVG